MSVKPRYQIYGRRLYEVNTDPQRRCYWGVHAKSEWVWTEWKALGSVKTEEEAIESVKSIDPTTHEYKYNYETSEWPELDPYYKSAEFLKLGEIKDEETVNERL